MTALFLAVEQGDVFVTLGSDDKYHVAARTALAGEGAKVTVRCGKKGLREKARVQAQHTTPPNVTQRHSVCRDCREFTTEVDL